MPKHRKLQAGSVKQIEKIGTGQQQQQRQMASGLVINFKCQICYQMFTSLEHLKLHERTQCCQTIEESLIKNSEANHSDVQNANGSFEAEPAADKIFTCVNCDQRFARYNELKKHNQSHGEKPFRCSKCDKTFANLTSLTKHEQIHAEIYITNQHYLFVLCFCCSYCGYNCL